MDRQELHQRNLSSPTLSPVLAVSNEDPAPQSTEDNSAAAAQERRHRTKKEQLRWGAIGVELPPQIKRRHISVISVGGVIGTGLYISTSTALRHAGPAGTVLGYIITGSVVWSVVISIGEIVAFLPNVGGPVGLANLYVDPALGFALGWNAWYNWTIILPAELSAATILTNGLLERKGINFIGKFEIGLICGLLVVAVGINCFGARAYGEAEFLFSCFKILTILSLIIMGIVMDAGGWGKPQVGFKNWKNPGPFVEYRASGNLGRFLGVWSSMSQAVFAFFGTEVPGVAAGEVENPVQNIPRAINRVWIRITLFYVLAVFVADLEGQALVASSPFIIAIRDHASAEHLDKFFIVAFIVSAFSAAVSDVYVSSRFLYYLGRCRHAPRFCAKRLKTRGTTVPWVGILVSAGFGLLSFMSTSDAEEAFHWLSSMTSTAALLSWIGMLVTYIRFWQGTRFQEKKSGNFKLTHQKHLYDNRYRLQPGIAIYALVMCILILIFNGWFTFTRKGPWRMANEVGDDWPIDEDIGKWVPTFITSYITIPVFFLLLLGYKMVYRTKMVRFDKMEFDRGHIKEIPEKRPTTWWGKALDKLF